MDTRRTRMAVAIARCRSATLYCCLFGGHWTLDFCQTGITCDMMSPENIGADWLGFRFSDSFAGLRPLGVASGLFLSVGPTYQTKSAPQGVQKMTGDPMRQAGLERRLANMAKAPRCGARTRTGRPCRQAAVRGRTRCRMHGGAKGSGGRSGVRNGNFKHGLWTRDG